MKSWTTVMAWALAIGLMSAPVSVYADSHEGGEKKEEAAAAEGSEEAASSEEAAPEASEGDGACGGGDAAHEGSH